MRLAISEVHRLTPGWHITGGAGPAGGFDRRAWAHAGDDNLRAHDRAWWDDYRDRLERAAPVAGEDQH
jgi:hypothetical protein